MDEFSLAGLSVGELRSVACSLERDRVVARFWQLRVYAELHERGFESMGLRGLPDLIQADLRCSRSTARALAVEVARFVGRNSVVGEPLDPVYPIAAGALEDGSVGFDHAKVIGDVIDALPVEVQVEHAGRVEAVLVKQAIALELDPRGVKTLAERIVAHLDPDGPEPRQDRQYRHRRLELSLSPDGTGLLQGRLTAECAAIWQAALAPLAAQRNTSLHEDGTTVTGADELGRDSRTLWQRQHDAFEEAGRRLLKTGNLPDHAGLPAQLLITIDLRDLERRAGRATTHHGGTLTTQQALHLAAEAKLIPVILDQELGLVEHGRGRRLASPIQRKAIFARDRGCTFPGCSRTAANSEVHHMLDWLKFVRTNPDNLTLTCGYHNNEAPRQGWKAQLVQGIPHWTPPRWRDPEQKPRRNWLHHPELLMPSRR